MYEKGDKLIHTKFGTDFHTEDVYYIQKIFQNKLTLTKNHVYGERCIIYRDVLDCDLTSDYPQFRIEKTKKPYNMDEELFKL